MIHRSSSSKRRKPPRSSPSNSPHRSTGSLSRKPNVTFSNLPPSDDDFEPENDNKNEWKTSGIIASSTGTSTVPKVDKGGPSRGAVSNSRGSVSTTSSVANTTAEFSGGFKGSITVTDTDKHETPAFPISEYTTDDKISGSKMIPSELRNSRGSVYYDVLKSRGSVGTDVDSFNQRGGQNSTLITRKSSRSSLMTESSKSPRSSLIPDDAYQRTSRGSIDPSIYSRGSRNSLLPEGDMFSRSPRPSIIADVSGLQSCGRNTLPLDVSPHRSSRTSLIPESSGNSRNSLSVDNINRSPRGSLVPEVGRSPRGSLVPENIRTPRGSLVVESFSNRATPRGSVASEGALYSFNRNSRSSLPQDSSASQGKSPRGSIASSAGVQLDQSLRTPRGSVESAPPLTKKSASGVSVQNQRSVSPFRTGSLRITSAPGAGTTGQTNIIAAGDTESSRRASSNVSQVGVSSDDRRHLCEHTKLNQDTGLGLTAYGSFVYQLNHANMESSGICDFIFRALRIVYRTVIVTVLLTLLTALPLLMLIMGVEFAKDCPQEPRIPRYMTVGGCFGLIMILCILWHQIRSLRYERLSNPSGNESNENEDFLTTSAGTKIACIGLSLFLVIWFILGNKWIYGIYWPEFEQPTIFEPDKWCHKTLYIFSLVHLFLIYAIFGIILLLIVAVGTIQVCFLKFR